MIEVPSYVYQHPIIYIYLYYGIHIECTQAECTRPTYSINKHSMFDALFGISVSLHVIGEAYFPKHIIMKVVLYFMCLFLTASLLRGQLKHENLSPTSALAKATVDVICGCFAKRTSTLYVSRSGNLFRNIPIFKSINCNVTMIINKSTMTARRSNLTYLARSNMFLVHSYADFRWVNWFRWN